MNREQAFEKALKSYEGLFGSGDIGHFKNILNTHIVKTLRGYSYDITPEGSEMGKQYTDKPLEFALWFDETYPRQNQPTIPTKFFIKNLTGHDIHVYNEDNKLLHTLKGNSNDKLRASVDKELVQLLGNVPIYRYNYKLETTLSKFKQLTSNCDAIIVSSIMANILRNVGYEGRIFIVGAKAQVGNLRGCYGLSEV